jgi:hypothetical protein
MENEVSWVKCTFRLSINDWHTARVLRHTISIYYCIYVCMFERFYVPNWLTGSVNLTMEHVRSVWDRQDSRIDCQD